MTITRRWAAVQLSIPGGRGHRRTWEDVHMSTDGTHAADRGKRVLLLNSGRLSMVGAGGVRVLRESR